MADLIKKYCFKIIIIAVIAFACQQARAQNVKDSFLSFPLVGVQYAFDIPAGDLAKSYGVNSTIGISYWRKTAKNWLFGLEYNYIFTDIVKINPLDSIMTSDGYILNGQGQFQSLAVYERGHFVMLKAGKIFKTRGENVNSGFVAKAGAGFWLHEIFYYWTGNAPAQLSDKYINGYDRMSYGPALSESFGYIHFGNNHRINYSAELEIAEGFTKNQRAFNYDTRTTDNATHFDMTFGIKLAWYFPLYKQTETRYYY
jgi:hypothetical protein